MAVDNIGMIVDKEIGTIFVEEIERKVPLIKVFMRAGKHVLMPVRGGEYAGIASKILAELGGQEITSVSPMVRRKGSPKDDGKSCGYACPTARPGDDLYVYVAVDNINFWYGLSAVYEPNKQ